ncbi:hypothetical protein ASG76_06870 [Nocardioides sp. Soil774]|uniref:ATP-binding protein n=1 Tax=Nocardioides sp. Soil774 TaxID=1736408 RepID=UPI0006FA447D|nr:AAA family ATPase [Nocardioides sp. Soil774]KRE95372.1 hypothetical protein ASG76_06870 [Nocardioides sp. Soil774]
MGALPRPDLAPGPHRDLVLALHDLHRRGGWPSLRTLARAAGCSHTTVSSAFSSPRLPGWGLVELLGEAMQGDVAELRALWLAASDGTTAARHPRELAGRRTELARVRRHLTSGQGLLLVVGEAGMGKTCLAGAAVEVERPHLVVTAGTCLRLSTEVPLLPVADVLRGAFSVDDGRWLEAALGSCAPYVAGSLQHLLPELAATGPPPDPADDWARQRLFAAVEAVLSALAAVRPTAVFVEDVHWADTATFDLLEHMAARGSTVPLLATWRSADPETPPEASEWLARVRRHPGVDVLELAPLGRDETGEQLALLMGGHVDADVVDRVHARSSGHPLFTEHLAAAGSAVALPGALADVLDHRFEGLPAEASAVARVLGVADRPLGARELVAVTGLESAEVTRGLRALAERRLLLDPAATEVQLGHPLLAEAIRRTVVASEAVELHRGLAEVLGSGSSPSAAEVATHWQAAGDRVAELDWRVRAARAAEQRFALANAAQQWLRVLELWPTGAAAAGSPPISRWTACLGAMDALSYSGDISRSVELVEEALSWAAALSPQEAGEVHAWAGGYRTYFRNPGAGLPLLDRAIELFAPLPPSKGKLYALTSRAGELAELGRFEERSATLAAALEVSRALDDPVKHREACLEAAIDDYCRGDRAALDRVADLAALVLPTPDPLGDIRAAQAHADLLRLEGAGRERVQAAARRGLAVAEAWEIDNWETTLLRWAVAEAAWDAGRVDEAAAVIDPLTEGPLVGDRAPLHLARAVLDTLRGRPRAGVGLAALDQVVPTLRVWFVPCVAEVRLWCDEPQEAFDLLVGDVERRLAGGYPQPGRAVVTLLARSGADLVSAQPPAGRLRRRHEVAERINSLVEAMASLPADPDGAMDVATPAHDATYVAERARLADRETIEVWVAAAREWDRVERPHDAAYCRWRAARVAVASGQAAVADRLLRRAAQQAREHVPLLEAIAAVRATR